VWNVAILALIGAWDLAGNPVKAAGSAGSDREVPQGLRMTMSATTERIPLLHLHAPPELSMDSLARRVRLIPSRKDQADALAAQIMKHAGVLCPKVTLKGALVEMTCRDARFEAQITKEGRNLYLDINELRGLPWRGGFESPPSYYYDPWRMGLGQRCPGKSPAVRGECALKEGNTLEAAKQFRAALDTSARQMASVRLGDLAVATGDPITAGGWYRRTGDFGYFGRVAEARLCELEGKCLHTTEEVLRAFDPTGLPEPLRAESQVRAARAEAYMGRLMSAVHIISTQERAHGMASICREGGELICRRIVLQAMQETMLPAARLAASANPRAASGDAAAQREKTDKAYLEELLEVYLAIPSWDQGPMAVELVQAAASVAARLGAPAFGGNLLAALAPQVPERQLADHLLLAAETFVVAQSWARARIIVEYAQSRARSRARASDGRVAPGGDGKATAPSMAREQGLRGPRWKAVYRALSMRSEEDEISPAVRAAMEATFAATLIELKKSHATLAQAESVLRAGKDAHTPSAPSKIETNETPAGRPPGNDPEGARAALPTTPSARSTAPGTPSDARSTTPPAAPPSAVARNQDPQP